MGLFAARRRAEFEQVSAAIAELQRLVRREGAAAAADDSWKLMRRCFQKMAFGKPWYAPLTMQASRVSFGVHVDLGQWFFAACSGLSFATAVAALDADCTKRGVPFPEEFFPGMQLVSDLSADVAHRAGVPLVGALVAEALTGLAMGDRTIARETADLLDGTDTVERLRALRRGVRDARRGMREAAGSEGADSIAALREMADGMLVRDLDATLDKAAKGHLLSGSGTVAALLAASKTSRAVLYVAPGEVCGTAIRINAPESGREVCESVSLPALRTGAVRDLLGTMHAVLSSDEPRKKVRDRAVREAHTAVRAAVWTPLLRAWPDLLGGRVALIPLGESTRLPLWTAPVDDTGTPACGLMDLTVAPSGNALMFASAWPRPERLDPLVAADPWFHDGEGAGPIPFTVPEAREVAAVHGVKPLLFRQEAQQAEGARQAQGAQQARGARPARGAGGPARGPDTGTGTDTDADECPRGLTRAPGPAALSRSGAGPGPASAELAGLMAAANLIHLAGHGFLDPSSPLDSAVLLGRPLPLSALLAHDLRRGTTVVLSACHLAGIGTQVPGEQLGFPAALLAMGASTVVAALWAVPDSAETGALMAAFHRELAGGALPSAALGRAVAHAAAGGARPTMWGPFTHFGA